MRTIEVSGDFYRIDGEEYVRVTRVTGVPAKPGLDRWKANTIAGAAADLLCGRALPPRELLDENEYGYEYEPTKKWLAAAPDRIRDKAAGRGTDAHGIFEGYARTGEVGPWPEGTEIAGRRIERFLRECRPRFAFAEVLVLNRTYRYAGRIDGLLETGGDELDLLDLKTGKSVWEDSLGLQLSGYEHGEVLLLDDGREIPMPKIRRRLCLHAPQVLIGKEPPDSDAYWLHEIALTPGAWDSFRAARRLLRWVSGESKGLLRPADLKSREVAA